MTTEDVFVTRWKAIETGLKESIRDFVASSYRDALRLVYDAELSDDCIISLTTMLKGLQELKADVFRMVDASGKIPTGFSDGSLAELGDFDMCLRAAVKNSLGDVQFRGQYCSLTLNFPLPPKPPIIRYGVPVVDTTSFADDSVVKETLNLAWGLYTAKVRFGLCFPDRCQPPELDRLLRAIAEKAHLNSTLLGCVVEENLRLNKSQIIAM
ncbi:hypothetical protein IscW_ISCW012088 [Ixodes scapularis]|uniref:Nose resistant-to-fluoxetine protein N-terminal domain-containing protein n=1 Tax=Ixodes scapularis TaxID=6945 RepID=B7QBT0_IXOSC|nr:hypothetical protein IscW_ISCW012088 [Ixodes scapularis]|eukprot:XP_002412994.1 hypothetical protein IscW_ISCW012088 [Ixodes scapularis]